MKVRKDKKIALVGIIIIIGLIITAGYVINTKAESITTLTKESEALQIVFNEKQHLLDVLNLQLNNIRNDLNETSDNLNEKINELELRQLCTKYSLHDPLYWEARNFLEIDTTDKKYYDEDTFNCANYAQEVNNNAEKKGIRCAFVSVYFVDSDSAHVLIAFNTTDQGLKFFEPQSDERVNLQIGKDYWTDCVIPNGNYYYIDEPGDTIESYVIYW